MESFVKLFFDREFVDLPLKLLEDSDENSEINIIKIFQKFIFKQDVVADFKKLLHSVCWSEEISICSDVFKKTVQNLVFLLSSEVEDKIKVKAFHCIFRAFALSCKDCEESVIQLFIVLAFTLGFSFSPDEKSRKSVLLKKDAFENAFEVKITMPYSTSFMTISKLLFDFSQLSVNLNSSENQKYYSWFSEFIKNIASSKSFDNTFFEIFCTSCEIDIKLFEGNLEIIFTRIFSQKKSTDSNFFEMYKCFLVKTFKICSKYQRSQKFISRFFLCLKSVNTTLTKDVILPQEFLSEFSNNIRLISNQQSLSGFEVLLQHLHEVFSSISQNNSDVQEIFLRSLVEVTKIFFEEAKIFSPSLSATSANLFIEKLKLLKSTLKTFGNFLSEDISFPIKNTPAFLSYLELCYYCTEIEILMNCYKDFFLEEPSNSSVEEDVPCIDDKLWKALIKIVLKSKIKDCYLVCLQIALQKLRIFKLDQKNILDEESAQKIIVTYFLSKETNETVLDYVSPEDMTVVVEVLTKKQQKIVVEKILKEILKSSNTGLKWLSDSKLQENITFVIAMFTTVMKETKYYLNSFLDQKSISKFKWLEEEYFVENNTVDPLKVENLSNTIDTLLKKMKPKKVKFELLDNKEKFLDIVEVFRTLPLVNLSAECRQLGISYAIGILTICSTHKETALLLLECILNFLNSDVDPSMCLNVGLCIKWLSDLYFENKEINDLRIKIIETLVRSCPHSKHGLNQIGEIIQEADNFEQEIQLRTLETQVTLYSELGKCWLRAKKRKADNDLIGSYRSKLAKVISEKANELNKSGISPDNYKVLFKIAAFNLNKALKSNNEADILEFIQIKFQSFFEFAINNLETERDESSVLLLCTILQGFSALRKLIPVDSLWRIWLAFKRYDKMNWRLFPINSTEEEFNSILCDLLNIAKTFLSSEKESASENCFEIWMNFFESCPDVKINHCQMTLQKLFDFIIDSEFLITDLQIRKKYLLTKFLSFCVANRKVILTSQMMDVVVYLIVESSNEKDLAIKEFHDLFIVRIETCSAILSRQFAWNKNKVHLIYDLFQHMLSSLTNRCHTNLNTNNDEVFLLSACAFSLEKWVSLMTGKQKDFARIGAYFIATIISVIASVTLPPAIKIHLFNCLNHFLSMSDSHTNSYLLRVLKPGYQQVFNSVYEQFKKFYKFSGKV